MNATILDWSQALTAGLEECGGKAWNLARLHQFGFLVPGGGVLTSALYQQVINHPDIIAPIEKLQLIGSDLLTAESTTQLLAGIRRSILNHDLPQEFDEQVRGFLEQQQLTESPLAIRSSATLEDGHMTSFAGIHESYLNIRGMASIKRSVLDCFASLWTPRAVAYRRKMGIDDNLLSCSVVIMELVDALSSGIAFTCDPATGRQDVSVINANFGLGESVVSGVVEPDEYQLNSHHMTLLKQTTGEKSKYTKAEENGGTSLIDSAHGETEQVLSEAQIRHLGRLIQRLFWALGNGEQHQDIEWTFDGRDFYLLQARPVTALPRLTYDILRNQQEVWSNGNFRDAAPMVQTTLGASALPHHIDAILGAPFEHIGYQLPPGLSFVKLFQGRAYFNVSLIQWVYFDSIGYPPAATNRNIGGHQPEIRIDTTTGAGISDKLLKAWRTLRLMREMKHHKKAAVARIARETLFTNSLVQSDFTHFSDEEILARIQLCDQKMEAYTLPFALLASLSGSLVVLYEQLDKYMPGKGKAIANALLAGAGNITSANHGYRLQELALVVESDPFAQRFFNTEPFLPDTWRNLPESSPFKLKYQEFIDEYGHRAVYEGDISNPRWREDSTYLLNVIKQSIETSLPSMQKAQQQEKANQAWKIVEENIPFYLRPIIKSLVRQAVEGAAFREMAKSHWIRLLEPARLLFLETGRRLESRGLLQSSDDVFHCAYIEVMTLLNGEWNGCGLESLVESRRREKVALEKLSPPDLILGDQPQFTKAVTANSGTRLTGMGVSSGTADGVARLVRTPEQGVTLNRGDVLVAPSTDPAWTPLFLNAAAIVVETGGQLSHGAIVAREYGIPAVVNIPGLFDVINDGERIAVDGDHGTVEKISA